MERRERKNQEASIYGEAFESLFENGLELLAPRDEMPLGPNHCGSPSLSES